MCAATAERLIKLVGQRTSAELDSLRDDLAAGRGEIDEPVHAV